MQLIVHKSVHISIFRQISMQKCKKCGCKLVVVGETLELNYCSDKSSAEFQLWWIVVEAS